MTVPSLMALSQGILSLGEYRCFYCGSACGDQHRTGDHVKSSFTGRDGVFAPGSSFVCSGCVLCLKEKASITLIDGAARDGQMMRGYSWILDSRSALAATKAHIDILRRLCLEPPEPPFAICLSDSGQKHLLYRGVVNHDRTAPVVTLEGEKIGYRPIDLAARLDLCGKLIAATGKPALRESVSFRFATAILARYRDGESLVAGWSRVREEPLSRLAAWLAPNKEESALVHASDFAS